MEANTNSTAGQAFGVTSFIIGIIVFIVSLIKCIHWIAIIPGIVAIVCSVIAYFQANRENAPKTLIIAAFIIAVVGTTHASYKAYSDFVTGMKKVKKGVEYVEQNMDELEGKMDDLEEKITTEIEEEVESSMEDLEKEMERLEQEAEQLDEEMREDSTENSDNR